MSTDLDLLTPEQVSDLLKVSVDRLAQWRTRGQGPKFVKLERLVRYRASDIEAWLTKKQPQWSGDYFEDITNAICRLTRGNPVVVRDVIDCLGFLLHVPVGKEQRATGEITRGGEQA